MDHIEVVRDVGHASPLTNPRPWLLASLLAAVVGAIMPAELGTVPGGIMLGTLVLGCLLAGGAVAIAPRSPMVLGLAGVAVLAISCGFVRIEWDSAVLLLRILAVAAGVTAVVQCLPCGLRRAFVSILLVLHFGGILTAVTSMPPTPWLSSQLWAYFYRPYLQFMYLNNSYHFYSPEPGPTTLLWFCIEYEPDAEGKNWRWVKVPAFDAQGHPIRPDGSPLWPNLEYIRRTSLAGNVASLDDLPLDQAVERRRLQAVGARRIPLHPDMTMEEQFQPPAAKDVITVWLSSCARHLAYACPHPTKPQRQVTGIKVYGVIHAILDPQEVVRGFSPDDPTTYRAYYLGEYDKDGNRKPYTAAGTTRPRPDPLLFWLIPIVRESIGSADRQVQGAEGERINNYVYRHAGVPDRGELP